jgi:hypothetical protein
MSTDALAAVARAEEAEKAAYDAYRAAVAERKAAIVAAYQGGHSLHEIADVLGTTHEVPRRIVRAAGA